MTTVPWIRVEGLEVLLLVSTTIMESTKYVVGTDSPSMVRGGGGMTGTLPPWTYTAAPVDTPAGSAPWGGLHIPLHEECGTLSSSRGMRDWQLPVTIGSRAPEP